jgi:hypothetical protein
MLGEGAEPAEATGSGDAVPSDALAWHAARRMTQRIATMEGRRPGGWCMCV